VTLVIFLVSGAVDKGFVQVEDHQVFEAFLLELKIKFLVFRNFLILVDIEFTFEPGDLLVDFMGQLIVLRQLEGLLGKSLEVAPVEG